ncbi:MAG: RiPP maturation radical SAM protein 1 [Deltaproteobacteria bacterium]|nr:RiPP maturation radical SAM protein 1 [Deltaproteobacteria bacterium]
MRLTLVSLPWAPLKTPSVGLSALAAFVEKHAPGVDVRVSYGILRIAELISLAHYQHICAILNSGNCLGPHTVLADALWTRVLFPERAKHVDDWINGRFPSVDPVRVCGAMEQAFDEIIDTALEDGTRVIGLTSMFNQLLGNLALAKRAKERAPELVNVFGGFEVSGAAYPPLLELFPQIDYIIDGEGEHALVDLVKAVEAGESPANLPGVRSRFSDNKLAAKRADVRQLPVPTFVDYAEQVEPLNIEWKFVLEGSRGCWWDRSAATGNANDACHFCNINTVWGAYREKTVPQIAAEAKAQAQRHGKLLVHFTDSIVRNKGIDDFCNALAEIADWRFNHALRAHIKPIDFVRLYEAGLRACQFGIEAMSTKILKRMNKGVSVIQNIQALKLCTELQVVGGNNIIINYPHTTAEEIAETAEIVERYCLGYQPLVVTPFMYVLGSTFTRAPELSNLKNIRNYDYYAELLPAEHYERMNLLVKDYDEDGAQSWDQLIELLERWQTWYKKNRNRPALKYERGPGFINIKDARRPGQNLHFKLEGTEADIYFYCLELRRVKEVQQRFPQVPADELDELIEELVEANLMFREGNRVLALACSERPLTAAMRIRAHAREDEELEQIKQAARDESGAGVRQRRVSTTV